MGIQNQPIGDIYNRNNEIVGVAFEGDKVVVTMCDQRAISVPLSWFPFLEAATPEQKAKFRILGDTVNWDDLDDGFSIEPLLLGKPKTA